MPERRAFIDAILEAPDDDAPRLVFADWLDEYGGDAERARAEFIRLQCEAAKRPAGDPRRADLERREDELLVAHGAEWARGLPGHVNYWTQRIAGELQWQRGFPCRAYIDAG